MMQVTEHLETRGVPFGPFAHQQTYTQAARSSSLEAGLHGRWRQATLAVMVLLSLHGLQAAQIAALLDCHPATVCRWISRFNSEGMAGLADRPRCGRPRLGGPVRSQYRSPGEPRSPKADAIIVAPATYNTINKWANGISDNYALGILAEAPGLGIPVVVLPFVNSALASRPPFRDSIAKLRAEGVRILLGPGQFEPHPPGTGGEQIDTFPWALALTELNQLARAQRPHGPRRPASEETGS
jgi:hypothetical protein